MSDIPCQHLSAVANVYKDWINTKARGLWIFDPSVGEGLQSILLREGSRG